MWRVLLFFGLLCVAAYGAVWLANHPETVAVTWAGREYSTSLAVGVVGLLAVAGLIAVTLGAIRAAMALPGALGRGSRRRRHNKGLQAISRGMVAVGAGDLSAARRHAAEAERLLGNQPLALLLRAQAAQASGQREAAESAFRQMVDTPDTRVLGLRGLFLEARRRGDAEAARAYAEEAAHDAPAIAWANDAVLEGYSADGDWAAAIRMIERRTSLGLIDRATSRRQRAVLLTADAQAREGRDPDGALAAVQEAVKLAPDLVPAAGLAARLLSRRGDLKRAAKIVETAWSANPHPDLAAAYLNLRPGDSATDRLRRAETLARLSSWSTEARLAIARAAIEARDLARAREVLRPVLEEERPTVRVCLAMAEIEQRSGNEGGAREWLARAARAPRDKAWMADGVASEAWAPVSPVSGRIDAFEWAEPPDLLGSGAYELPDIAPDSEGEPAPALPERASRVLGLEPPPASSPAPESALPEPPASHGPKAGERPREAEPSPGAIGARPAAEPDRAPPPGPIPAKPAGIAPAGAAAPHAAEPSRQDTAAGSARPQAAAGAATRTAREGAGAAQAETSGRPGSPTEPEPTLVAEPIATEPPRRSGANGGGAPPRKPAREPEPVVFPVAHPPDDPGPEAEGDRRQRFRLRV